MIRIAHQTLSALVALALTGGAAPVWADAENPVAEPPEGPALPPVTVSSHLFIQRGLAAEQQARNARIRHLEARLAESRKQQESVQARMVTLQNELAEAQQARSAQKDLQAEHEQTQLQLQSLVADLERLETATYSDRQRHRDEQVRLENERDQLKDRLAAQADRLTAMARHQQRAIRLEADLAELKQAHADLEKQAAASSAALARQEQLKKDLAATLKIAEAGLEEIPPPPPDPALSQALEKAREELRATREALAAEKKNSAEAKALRQQSAEATAKLNAAQQALSAHQKKSTAQAQRLAQLEQGLKQEQTLRAQAEARLQEARQKPATPAPAPRPVPAEEPEGVPVGVYETQVAKGDQLRAEDPKASAAAYALALAANPDGAQAHLGLASIAYTQSNFSDCLGHLATVLKRQPDHASGIGLKALALGALARHKEAITSVQRALSLAPKEARLHHYAGVVHYGAEKYPEAIRYFEQTTQLDARYGEAWYNLAWLYVQDEPPRKEKAKTAYEKWKSLGGDPDSLLEAALK